jgi:hypothetical protein
VVHGIVVAMLAEELRPEVGPVVVVAHGPDDLRIEILAGRLDDCAELGVGLGIAFVRQVAGKNHGFGAGTGRLDLVEELNQAGFAVNCAV